MSCLNTVIGIAWTNLGAFDQIAYPTALGVAAGSLSMLIYGRFSPQSRLETLKAEIVHLRQKMAKFDGEFSGALALTRQNLQLSFRRLRLVLVPSLLSCIPVLAMLPVIGDRFIAYFVAVACAAIAVKHFGKIA